ncbi:MAG TPA: GtrA family protein [Bradyrhizobium sp.]|nr:GtrA family protein [Bradyrhizobium sp.]
MPTFSHGHVKPQAGKRRQSWLISAKALSFALIGVINTAVDYGVFLVARSLLQRSTELSWQLASLAGWCRCAHPDDFVLILANVTSWSIAITGSYFMNALITFATETGRQLRWHSYARFVAAGAIGLAASTATLLVCVQMLLLPVWLAKLIAVGASFFATFSLAHLVVFKGPSLTARK